MLMKKTAEPEKDDSREIEQITKNTELIAKDMQSFLIIKSESDLQNSMNALVRISRAKKELTEKRMSITRTIDDAKKRVMELFRKPTETIEGIERAIKEGISKWHEGQEAEREKARIAQAKAEKKADFLEGKGEQAKADEIRAESAIAGAGINDKERGVRMIWKFEIMDASKVPFLLCSPDEKKIREFIQKTGQIEIAGVKVWKERSIVAR
jgi:hypothetical protein